jgi:hypothetical protein
LPDLAENSKDGVSEGVQVQARDFGAAEGEAIVNALPAA